MSYEDPTPQEEPTSRLAGRMPWILLGIGGLAILAVLGAILAMRRGGDQVNVSVASQATSTPAVVGVPVTVVITATSGPPTLIIPTPTRESVTVVVPTAAPKAPPTSVVVAPPAAPPPIGSGGQSAAQSNPTPIPLPSRPPVTTEAAAPKPESAAPKAPVSAPTAPSKPTAQEFRGEVSPSGGAGNSRASFDGTYGAPTGESPSRLVVYQRAPREYQVLFGPEPQRALLVAARPLPGQTLLTLDAARDVARALLPNDAQRRTTQPEGNQQFVVERYHSNTLAQAIPDQVAREWGGEDGDLIVVFQRSPSDADRIERVIVAVGDNVDRARQRAG